MAKSAGKAVFGDVLGRVAYAPVFWYTRGAIDAALFCLRLIARRWKTLGLGVWITNIFVPMFGQHDIAGKLISFFMRVVQIIGRGIVMVLWVILITALYVAYLVAPIFVFIELLRQIAGVFVA